MEQRTIRRVVITGPTGAIGTALIRELIKQNTEVIAVCRPGSARLSVLPQDPFLRVVECDLAALSSLPALCPEGADAFYHFGWGFTTGAGRNDMHAQTRNVDFTVDAVYAAKEMGCRVFIGAGSQAEYGRVEGRLTPETPCFPETGYGAAKLCAGSMSRTLCSMLGLDHVWVRILSIYGPGDNAAAMIPGLIKKLLAGEKPALTAGEQFWDYLYSDDAGRAFDLIARHGQNGKTYVLGGGTAKPLKEYVSAIRDAVDPALPLGFGDIPYSPLQVMHLEADISALTEDTGFIPQVAFDCGIRQTIEAIKKETRHG
ncbi:MAG: NAD(P)-dependent oxidoreductase [Clostridia bacterium]|nr:NAD(P)-dependent oxidoreductase [Clostridia bacterium]